MNHLAPLSPTHKMRCFAFMASLAVASVAIAQTPPPPANTGQPGEAGQNIKPTPPVASDADPATTPPHDPSDPLFPYFDAKQKLRDDYGLKVGINWDLTTQNVVAGPMTLSREVARYDFYANQKLWQGAAVDLDVRGGWGDGPDTAIGNTVNTNQYAQTGSDGFILHLYLDQKLADDQLTLRAGKFDIGDWLDTNRFGFYNFVGYSFAHNFAIPLPGNTLGVMATYEPKDIPWFYIQGGISQNTQTPYETGVPELIGSRNSQFFSMGEVGFKPIIAGQKGIYRFDLWYDPRNIDTASGESGGRYGVALSFDQNITHQLGLFARYGYADQSEFTVKHNWSAGFLIHEPIPGRHYDDFAVGINQNILTGRLSPDGSDYETYVETYYNAVIYEWLQLQPFVQVVTNPAAQDDKTEIVLGLHVSLRF